VQDAVNVARAKCPGASVAHCVFPAWQAGEWTCTSNPSSIALAFTSQRRATVLLNGTRFVDRDVRANTFGVAGQAAIAWIRVREPSECIEVTATRALRLQLAEELGVPGHIDLGDLEGQDPIVWALAVRLRARLRAVSAVDPLALQEDVIRLYSRVLQQHFGGRESVRGNGGLGAARAACVLEWIESHLDQAFSIADLARAAALTTSHFIRSFRRTTGFSPHQYVRARRLERARAALARGAHVTIAASEAGFNSVSQFRTAFRRQFGFAPGATPRRGVRQWIIPGSGAA
jgi:AraC-like DNA-binding protein